MSLQYDTIRSELYVIPGEPTSYIKSRDMGKRSWNVHKSNHFNITNILLEQHKDSPYFNGTLEMDIKFYFPVPILKNFMVGTYNIFKPNLNDFVRFVQWACEGILYQNSCTIAVLNTTKQFDENPRTEVCIKEIRRCGEKD